MEQDAQTPLQRAYEQLGLSPDASREAVEERYFLLLKKAKTGQDIDVEAVSRAYKTIVEAMRETKVQELEQQYYGDSVWKRKLAAFWAKHRISVIVSVALLLVAGMILHTVLDQRAKRIAEANRPPIDVYAMFVGEFYHENHEELPDRMLADFPEWQRVDALISLAPENPKDPFEVAALQKNVVMIMSERPDLYITDPFNFNSLMTQSAFLPLDGIADRFPERLLVRGQAETDDAPRVYGIDVSDSPLFAKWGILDKGKRIVGLRYDTERMDNAVRFIEKLIAEMP